MPGGNPGSAGPSDIDYYNEAVGRIYSSNPDLFMFSPAFCRCEGQTRLFSRWASGEEKVNPAYLVWLLRFFGKVIRDLVFSLLAAPCELNVPPGRGVFVFSYFDSRNSDNGSLREEYFRGILDGNPDVRCFYKLVGPGFLRRGASYLKSIATLKKKYFACAEHSFVTPLMIFKALWLTLLHWSRFAKTQFHETCDATVLDLLKSAHVREILDGTVYYGCLQRLLFESLLRHRPKVVLFVWENSPWERILERTKKQISPATISKGFQHTGFSKKLLQHYPSRLEGGLDTYPDYILCNGHVNRDELAKNPAISSKILVGGALRQGSLLRKGICRPSDLPSGRPMNIAYAFSWDQSTYDQILQDLNLMPDNVTVYLKFHPDYPDWLNKKDLPRRFINSRAPWAEIGLTCSLVLVNDNSLMFEGYYYGMHTAVYDGADPWGLEKRDFESSIPHLARSDMPLILSDAVTNRINNATRNVLESGYLQRYFVQQEAGRNVFLDA